MKMMATRGGDALKLRSRTIFKSTTRSPKKAAAARTRRSAVARGRTPPVDVVIGGREPRRPEPNEGLEEYKQQCRSCAVPALARYNAIAAKRGEMTYKLVDVGTSKPCIFRPPGILFHCNFAASPRHHSLGVLPQTMLFFAEVVCCNYPRPYSVNCCSRLGPVGSVFTGHRGCCVCGPVSSIHHPTDVEFFGLEEPPTQGLDHLAAC